MSKIASAVQSDWYAWVNLMQPGPPTLHVTGSIDTNDVSFGGTLVVDSIEKSNPPNLVLRVNYYPIFIPREAGNTVIRLHYSQINVLPGQYGKIKIIHSDGEPHVIEDIDTAF